MDERAVMTAEALLGCRRGITRAEVQSAYRRALLKTRPDLGAVDGSWVVQVQAARDLLLATAPPDRRRRIRRDRSVAAAGLRRSSWALPGTAQPLVDLRL